jgi:hypothetical protein
MRPTGPIAGIALLLLLLLPGGARLRAADPGGGSAWGLEDDAFGAGVRLEGTVHEAQGSPAAGARIVASGRSAHREVSSGTDGTFVLESLPPGVYAVQAIADGASSQPARVALDAGVEPAPLLLVLEAASKVTMRRDQGDGTARGATAAFLLAGACVATLAGAPRVAHSHGAPS